MTLSEIKNEVNNLHKLNDEQAFEYGLKLLQELRKHRKTTNLKTYSKIENKIHEERWRE